MSPAAHNPRVLIIIRAGTSSIHRSWIWTTHNLADVAISTYDDQDFSGDGVHYVHHFRGGKLPGISAFLDENPQVLDLYDYFWLFEDDLVLPYESLRRILRLLTQFPFELAAASLSHESFFTWALTVTNTQFIFRCTDFVEVMMPIMSRDFLLAAKPAFNDNFSGWGHEWLWKKLLKQKGQLAAIFDIAPVTHTRPFSRGSLSAHRPEHYDPNAELDAMVSKWSLDPGASFRNYFAVTNSDRPRLVCGEEMLRLAGAGYAGMQGLVNDGQRHCLNSLNSEFYARKEEALKSPTFSMVKASLDAVAANPVQPNYLR